MLSGKSAVVAVTGGIAAYKAADMVSKLKKLGARVQVIMTAASKEFITATTLSTLSGNPVLDDLFGSPGEVSHIDVATTADIVVIAPATANIIGKLAHGIADDFVSTVMLAVQCPVIIAPAMNNAMFLNPVVQDNLDALQTRGYQVVQPDSGRLACGTDGPGRLAPVETILELVQKNFAQRRDLTGKKILVTAGGTQEPIDPVRYVGNRSSGKMGFAVAAAAALRGAEVVLIHANTHLPIPTGVTAVAVSTADEMLRAVLDYCSHSDVVIKAAAVADYKPARQADSKMKKEINNLALTLVPTTDILAELGKRKGKQILVGFAAETDDLLANAKKKIQRKNLDLIVANDVSRTDIGFATNENQVTFLYADGRQETLAKMNKNLVAQEIMDRVIDIIAARYPAGKEE
ncbi:bifunctional phosphopantothenoylcysteine decarboxylase/phosphopantothenate--cysteine ligase CoaBC [Metallumcola ferriviriculae]|uniref:bifunctional phosphopantothenoylcysteine decarboxylase/phosphopantothenate--cysteine ligase CoaBC n=1 Tax=Metallumcola ferriviriculae TaxID=3039180 RepID=UPI003458BB0B